MNFSKARDPRMWARWRAAGAVSRAIKSLAAYAAGDARIFAVLTSELVNDVIDEAVGNWTQRHFQTPNPRVKAVLLEYATTIARKVFAGDTPRPDFSSSSWKGDVSNSAYRLLDYKEFKKQQVPVLVEALQPIFGDRRDDLENGLWGYSMAKVANAVGCAAYLVKNGFSPELFRATAEKAHRAQLELMTALAKKDPERVLAVDLSEDSPEAVAALIARKVRASETNGTTVH